MEKTRISFTKGSGRNTLSIPKNRNISRMPRHHLIMFSMSVFLSHPIPDPVRIIDTVHRRWL
jgi:hypothetical protein